MELTEGWIAAYVLACLKQVSSDITVVTKARE